MGITESKPQGIGKEIMMDSITKEYQFYGKGKENENIIIAKSNKELKKDIKEALPDALAQLDKIFRENNQEEEMIKPEDKENSGNFQTFIKAESIDLKELEKRICDCADFEHYQTHTQDCNFIFVRQFLADKLNRIENEINIYHGKVEGIYYHKGNKWRNQSFRMISLKELHKIISKEFTRK